MWSTGPSNDGAPVDAKQQAFRLTGSPGGLVIVRLSIASRHTSPLLIRPEMEAWVRPSGEIVECPIRAAPAYAYLAPGQDARLTLTVKLPADLAPGERLRGGLRFPAAERDILPFALEIVAGAASSHEHNISLLLPLAGPEQTDPSETTSTTVIYKLVACMAGLEVIPSKWLATELLITVCERGLEAADTPEGAALLEALSRTRLFKNGVLAFRGAHLASWAMVGASVSAGLGAALGASDGRGRMFSVWERWLLELIGLDIEDESSRAPAALPPIPDLQRSLERLGPVGDKWFGYLLLGLGQISSRIRAVLEAVAAAAPAKIREEPSVGKTEADSAYADVIAEKGSLQR